MPNSCSFPHLHHFLPPTCKVYNQIKECAATLCPLVQLDITIGSIPPAIIISLIMAIELSFSRRLLIPTCMFEMGALTDKEFTDQKLPIPDQLKKFKPWVPLSFWCFIAFIFIHVSELILVPCMHDKCMHYTTKSHGHDCFWCCWCWSTSESKYISDLIKIWETSCQNPNGYNICSRTYIYLLSCSFFLRKSEAAQVEMIQQPLITIR